MAVIGGSTAHDSCRGGGGDWVLAATRPGLVSRPSRSHPGTGTLVTAVPPSGGHSTFQGKDFTEPLTVSEWEPRVISKC